MKFIIYSIDFFPSHATVKNVWSDKITACKAFISKTSQGHRSFLGERGGMEHKSPDYKSLGLCSQYE